MKTPLSHMKAPELRHTLRQVRGAWGTLRRASVRYGQNALLEMAVVKALRQLASVERELVAAIGAAQSRQSLQRKGAA